MTALFAELFGHYPERRRRQVNRWASSHNQERSSVRKLFYRNVEGDVLASIKEICSLLESKGALYLKVSQEHDVKLFIGLFGNRNFGFELDCATLRRVQQLGLSLSFDIYPHDGDKRE